MNYYGLKGWSLLVVLAVLFSVGCSDDEDDNNATRDDYVAVWNISENCDGQDFNYALTITVGTSTDAVTLTNIHGFGPNAVLTGTVSGGNLTIATQTVQGVEFSGTGTLDNGTLSITYTFTQGATTTSCTATGAK